MDNLPEEIVDRVIAYLGPHSIDSVVQLRDLANVALVSRSFNRIATPHLYQSVPITVCKVVRTLEAVIVTMDAPPVSLDIPTTKGCNGEKFLECLQRRPHLASHVKQLTLLRNDFGFPLRVALGWYGDETDGTTSANPCWNEVEKAARAGRPIDGTRVLRTGAPQPVACLDDGFVTVRALLRLLPNIQQLDCTRHCTDVLWDPCAEAFKSLCWHPRPQVDFKALQNIKLYCGHRFLSTCWSVFMLPSVQAIHLDVVNLCSAYEDDLSEGWRSLHSSSVKELQLQDFSIQKWDQAGKDVFDLMLKAGKHLSSLTIESHLICQSRLFLDAVGRHSPQLRQLKVISHPQPMQASGSIGALLPTPENPPTPYLPVLRASTGLNRLTLDVADLLEIVEKTDLSDEHTVVLSPGASVMAHGEVLVTLDLTLPKSLTSLTLRISYDVILQYATINVLQALALQLNTRFPLLKRLETSWQGPPLVRSGKWRIGNELAGIIRDAGVDYVETCFSEGTPMDGQPLHGPEAW